MEPLCYIALVMLVSGAAGGLVNYFISEARDEKPLTWWQHVIVGIAAAYIVPLLLNMTSGDLIDKIRGADGKPPDYSRLFVLAGFCLVAAASSRAFIRSLSRRILEQAESANRKATEALKEASEAKAAVEPLVEQDEPSFDTVASQEASTEPARQASSPMVGNDEQAVLKAMTLKTSGYSMRTIAGISLDTKLSKSKVREALESLESKQLVSRTPSTTNSKVFWSLTPAGRRSAGG